MNKNLVGLLNILAFTLAPIVSGFTQHSVPHRWSEMLLESIRNDRARPPVHARNLFHVSAAMYDAWAAYDEKSVPWLLGNTRGDHSVAFDGVASPTNLVDARNAAISYAAYRLILHRFKNSPGVVHISTTAKNLMVELGYDPDYTSTDYTNGLPASLGNYIGASYIEFGLTDGANEIGGYSYLNYEPVNPPLIVKQSGNPFIINPNRWQPLQLDSFIDQSGNVVPGGAASFIGPEWGSVIPFSLNSSNRTNYERDGDPYPVYFDPGPPPYVQNDGGGNSQYYKWGFELVSKWGSHLDQSDEVMWDISPNALGNAGSLPTTYQDYLSFYDTNNGGDNGKGYNVNPKTGLPYTPQIVPRGDYTRVLAEFWADGPSSETPPGHWFTILNTVMDHPNFVKKFEGVGDLLDDLEWDVKAYFVMGGAMHDAAIAAWGVKGWYDYVRPVSAIRYLAGQGQSSDPNQPSYSPRGIQLSTGFIELIKAGDPLEGEAGVNIGKVKLYTWKGPNYISDPETDQSGVDWVLAADWWPYQRPTFVTPPFAGYVSGHSTYSRAAAEVMTMLTGDEFFPGGIAEFEATMNEYLVFEEGPSVNVKLQWAKYRDASDQCSLSRIWGGIHPPQDDIPGRQIGIKVAVNAFDYAKDFFDGTVTSIEKVDQIKMYPNPVSQGDVVRIRTAGQSRVILRTITGKEIFSWNENDGFLDIPTTGLNSGLYIVEKITEQKVSVARLWIN
jgi:hypothetical protein